MAMNDDNEPITREWFVETVGPLLDRNGYFSNHRLGLRVNDKDALYIRMADSHYEDQEILPGVKTRGDVRTLIRFILGDK